MIPEKVLYGPLKTETIPGVSGFRRVCDWWNVTVTHKDRSVQEFWIDDFTSDGASTPPIPGVRMLVPKFNATLPAAIFHDYLCSIAKDKAGRLYADRCFELALKRHGMGRIRRKLAYFGVRIGAFFGIGNDF